MTKEIILGTPREVFAAIGKHSVITSLSGKEIPISIMGSEDFLNMPFSGYNRPECEVNYNYVQLIPYIVLQDLDESTGAVMYVSYLRGKKGAEADLHGKYSVGVGGHVAVNDFVVANTQGNRFLIASNHNVLDIILQETVKEIMEEAGIDILKHMTLETIKNQILKAKAFHIEEGRDSVNSYHFAIPIVININAFKQELETSEFDIIEQLSFKTKDELKALADESRLEAWSDIVMNNFLPKVITAEYYLAATGEEPVNDDIARANCTRNGIFGHEQCGWCETNNVPNTSPLSKRWLSRV